MAASTAPAVKAALLALLQAESTLAGVQCEYADPGDAIQQESLFYGRTLTTEKPDSMGKRSQREAYDIEVYIYAAMDGNDPQTIEERCWTLVASLENVVRANNGNNGALTNAISNVSASGWVVFAGTEMTPFVSGGQRVAEALSKVHVEAIK